MPAKAAAAKIAKSDVYDQLEALLKQYSPPFTICPPAKIGKKRSYGLWSKKEVEIAGRKFPAVYFASLIEQQEFVGLYYTPIYMDPKMSKDISPRLLKTLKGKSCFHIKAFDDELLNAVKAALDLAAAWYQRNGWL